MRIVSLLLLVLVPAGCADPHVVVCDSADQCPLGTVCERQRCVPGQFAVLPPVIDVGPAEPDVVDAGPEDVGPGPDVAPPEDSGVDAPVDVPPADVPLADLAVSIEAPAGGDTVQGAVVVRSTIVTDPRLSIEAAWLEVDGVEVVRTAGPFPLDLSWATSDAIEGFHGLVVGAGDSRGRTARSPEVRVRVYNRPDWVQRDGDGFLLDGARWGLYGVAFSPPRQADAAAMIEALRPVHDAGFSAIEVQSPGEDFETGDNEFELSECAWLRTTLEAASATALKVLLVLPVPTDYPWLSLVHPRAAGALSWVHDPKVRSALARRQANVIERCELAELHGLLGYDVFRGPRAGDALARNTPESLAAWAVWAEETLGDRVDRDAVWGEAVPSSCGPDANGLCPPSNARLCAPPGEEPVARYVLDYRRFVRETTRAAVGDLVARLRLVDAHHLVTVGHGSLTTGSDADYAAACGDHGGYLDPRVGAEHLDFVMVRPTPWLGVTVPPGQALPEGQHGHEDDFDRAQWLASYARLSNLPVVLGGFSYAAQGIPGGDAIRRGVWDASLDGAVDAGAYGAVGIRWRDAGAGDGVVDLAGTPTTTAEVVAEHADALARPPTFSPDAPSLARPQLAGRFRDAVLAGMDAFRSARAVGSKVAVVTCDQIEDPLSCAGVEGCDGVCFP